MAMRLSALHVRPQLTLRKIPGTHFCRGWVASQVHSAATRIRWGTDTTSVAFEKPVTIEKPHEGSKAHVERGLGIVLTVLTMTDKLRDNSMKWSGCEFATDGQSASMSRCRAALWGP
jgi:hypothetical protein